LLVGERTNVYWFRDYSRIWWRKKSGRKPAKSRGGQVRGGAHIVDVCLQSTERDEKKDIPPFYEKAYSQSKSAG